jgi:competence protein ComEC
VLNKEIPFLRIVIPLCLGIVSGLYVVPGDMFFILSGACILILFCTSLFFNRQLTNPVYGISLMLALFISGLLLYTKEKERITVLSREEALFSGALSDYPEEKENTFRMVLKMDSRISNASQEKVIGSMVLYCRKSPDMPEFIPGDRLIIRCIPLEITSRGNPYEFDYKFYMECNGISYYSFIETGDIVLHSIPKHRKLIYSALIVRERIIGMFRERGIGGERLALVAAITLGQKKMLDPEQKLYFIKAGVMHIMAVSGLHAVILSMFIFRMLFFLRGRLNIIRVAITIIILWFFAFITGLTPSVLRATIMYSFLQTGNIIKRPVNGINSVLASAFVLILARPSVIFEAGFQLSYAAVISILMFYRDLYLKIHFRHRIPDLIWQSAAVTLIAQAGTLPLTIMLFNRFPTWFILSNIIIVPLSSLVVITGILVPIAFPVRFLSQFLATILNFMTGLTEHLTKIASSLPLSTIENIGITWTECIFLTLFVFLITRFLLDRKSIPVLFPLSALLLFILSGTIKDISTRKSSELIVYNTVGCSTIGIRNGNILTIYSDSIQAGQEVSRHSAVLNLEVREKPYSRTTFKLKCGGKNILITNILSTSTIETSCPDFIILTGKKPAIQKNIVPSILPEAIIVSPEVTSLSRISGELRKIYTGKVYFIEKQGAFSVAL